MSTVVAWWKYPKPKSHISEVKQHLPILLLAWVPLKNSIYCWIITWFQSLACCLHPSGIDWNVLRVVNYVHLILELHDTWIRRFCFNMVFKFQKKLKYFEFYFDCTFFLMHLWTHSFHKTDYFGFTRFKI